LLFVRKAGNTLKSLSIGIDGFIFVEVHGTPFHFSFELRRGGHFRSPPNLAFSRYINQQRGQLRVRSLRSSFIEPKEVKDPEAAIFACGAQSCS